MRQLTRDDECPASIKSPGSRLRREPGYGLGVVAICAMVNVAAAGARCREYTSAMRLRPLLLHVLLSLALVANGIGAAMASVHAVCTHVAVAAPVSGSPCHEGMGADAPEMHDGMQHERMQQDDMQQDKMHQVGWSKRSATPHDGMPKDDTPQPPPASDKDRCGDCADHCECACIAHGLAALMPSTLLLPAAIGIAYTPAPSSTHATPALPHPVRPPIG